MRHTLSRLCAAVFTSAAVTVALSGAAAATPVESAPSTEPTAEQSTSPTPMLAAMQRDLGLSAQQARARIALDTRASSLAQNLTERIGDEFAGAWISHERDQLVVAITDPALAQRVRSAGAAVRVVPRSLDALNAAKARLDQQGAPPSIRGWYVDPHTNKIVVVHAPSATAQAHSFVDAAGVDRDWVRFVASAASPHLRYAIRGGDAYYIDGRTRCSIGFSVQRGFVTAGHCGDPGARTTGTNGVAQGTFQGSSFPGNDYAWVRVNSNWNPQPVVNDYRGGTVSVAGSQEAAIGASVCRSGSTSGWHCGVIKAKNQTVNYRIGTVRGLTRTTVCAEPGDSGGSYISGHQAQGVTSGGTGDCTSGGITFFQPVDEILAAYGLTLVTTGGNNDPPQPPNDPQGCSDVPGWVSSTTYQVGDLVAHNGHIWEATYPSSGAEPGAPTSWAVWQDNGPC